MGRISRNHEAAQFTHKIHAVRVGVGGLCTG